ncbi:c-type cytochrome [Persephonella sp.]
MLIILFLIVFSFSFAEEYGYQVFKQYCSSCHIEKTDETTNNLSLKAPPIDVLARQIKYFYRTREGFAEYLENFIKEPSLDKSICKPCIDRWGIMPPVKDISDEEIQSISLWMFKNFR